MQGNTKPSFAFLVLVFNHQDYILEHLESIKYLVQRYGSELDVDLIINDDCSKDHSRELIDFWININSKFFRNVKVIYNIVNVGTCASVNNMLDHMKADRCKITAGDDVYSFENIFSLTQKADNVAIVSGRVLYLHNDQVFYDWKTSILEIASEVIYKNRGMEKRFKNISLNNAPNIYYSTACIKNPDVRNYLSTFQVTEDWPLQLAIADNFPDMNFELIDQTLVYYRRTNGSTYLVAGDKFKADKIKIYNDLIDKEVSKINRLRFAIRKYAFDIKNQWVRKVLNLDLYIFLIVLVSNFIPIIKSKKLRVIDFTQHQEHYLRINYEARVVAKIFLKTIQ